VNEKPNCGKLFEEKGHSESLVGSTIGPEFHVNQNVDNQIFEIYLSRFLIFFLAFLSREVS